MNLKLRRPLLGILGAVIAFGGVVCTLNAVSQEASEVMAVSEDSDSISFTFTNKDSISKEGWTSDPANLSWSADQSGRGISLSKAEGSLSYTLGSEYGVSCVTVTASANNAGYTLYVKNDSTSYGSHSIAKANNAVYKFDNCSFQPGDTVTLSWTKNSNVKSIMFKSVEFTKTLPGPSFKSLEISGEFKTTYYTGDRLNLDGAVVTAYFDDGSSKVLSPSEYSVSPSLDLALTPSDKSFVITYKYGGEEYTVSHDITVHDRALLSIEVSTLPSKLDYVVGQSLDTSGIVVDGTFEGNVISDITSHCSFSPMTLETVGVQTITVTHDDSGKATSFDVNVVERKVESLSLAGKTDAFDEGSRFTLGEDAKLVASWNDDVSEELTLGSEGVVAELLPDVDSESGDGIVIDDSYVLSAEDSGKYVLITYHGVAAKKYQISVRTVVDVSEGVFTLVSDPSELNLGDTILIVGVKNERTYALSTTQNKNNRGISPVDVKNETITLNEADPVELIHLEAGDSEGTYSLSVTGGYLYVNEDDNRLRTTTTKGENSSWEITAIEGESNLRIGNAAYPSRSIKLNLNASSDVMAAYQDSSDNMGKVSVYKYVSNAAIVKEFVDTYLHLSDYTIESGLCAGDDGYYAHAKTALLKLSDDQIELFKTDEQFADGYERYLAWARANGDLDPFGESNIAGAITSLINGDKRDSTVALAVFGLGLAAIAAGSAFIIKRRREEK